MHFVHHRWICKPLAFSTALQCLWSHCDKNVICHYSPVVKDCNLLIRNDGESPKAQSFFMKYIQWAFYLVFGVLRQCLSKDTYICFYMICTVLNIHPFQWQSAWQWSVLQVSLSVEILEWMWNCHSVTYILIKLLFIAVISIYCSNWDTAITNLKRKCTDGN